MKTNKKSATPPSAASPSCVATQEEIARYAYFIWEKEGHPEGHEIEHWLQAEAQARHGCRKAAVQQ